MRSLARTPFVAAAAWFAVAGCDGRPALSDYPTATCGSTLSQPVGTVELGAGHRGFEPMTAETVLARYHDDASDLEFFTFSVRATGLAPEGLCVIWRLDVTAADAPREAVAFDRYQLDFQKISGSADGIERIGIPGRLSNPRLVEGKPVRLMVQLVRDNGDYASGQADARFE